MIIRNYFKMPKMILPLAMLCLYLGGCTSSLRRPGEFGNWWVKIPRASEKKYFNLAFLGPASPLEAVSKGTFVGWHGLLINCSAKDGLATLLLEHRHAGEKNIQFGTDPADAIYAVSVFGDGRYLARRKGQCDKSQLPGDLIRTYGKVAKKSYEPDIDRYVWKIDIAYSRHWPRRHFDFIPVKPELNTRGRFKRSSKKPWPIMKWDHRASDKKTVADIFIVQELEELIPGASLKLRDQIAYNLGEIGGAKATLLLDQLAKDGDADPSETIKRAILRVQHKVGPWWNEAAPYPHWKR